MEKQFEQPTVKKEIDLNANAKRAFELLSAPVIEPTGTLSEMYAQNDEKNAIETVEVKLKKPSVKVMYASELLVGNQAADVDFYNSMIDRVAELPKESQPDVFVMSGIVSGDFKFFNKPQRAGLVPGVDGMGAQFREARILLDRAFETGAQKVVYNMSDDDRRIAEDFTVEVFRKISDLAKAHAKAVKDSEKEKAATGVTSVKHEDSMNWAAVDKMRQNPHWNEHLQFQIDTVFPYCLRAGRRLYTAEEMAELTEGSIDIEEYFLLHDIADRKKNKQRLTSMQRSWLNKVSETQNNNIVITDDLNLHITTQGKEYTDWIRHSLGFSPGPAYQNHMNVPSIMLAQLAANGLATPDMLVTQNNKEMVGVSNQNHWNISTGALIDPIKQLNFKGSHADIKGDVSRRLMATRKRLIRPSAEMHERTDDGRHIVTFWNDTQMEKSHSIPEMSIMELCDFQTGSITAKPDLLVKFLSYGRERVIGQRSTALFFGGDMVHGRNYPHFPSESQQTGLMAIESQKEFNELLFRDAFDNMTTAELEAIVSVLVQPGNHEWNSGTLKWHGDRFVDYMKNVFREMFARGGYSNEQIASIVKTHAAFMTPAGEYATGDVGIQYFGDFGVLIQHYLMERGAKGATGGLPVYQASQFVAGGGDNMRSIDILMAGHWHHPQYGLFNDKIAMVGGSMAGQSDYELKLGYRPTPGGTIVHIGGGKPTQIEFISEQALQAHTIKTGRFTDEQLADEGYETDAGFDARRHGIFLPDSFPKSALQKKLKAYGRFASQRAGNIAEFRS
ncbi:MAG: hypothetical protein WAQ27_04760 [Candidatus Microsaccharimonas sp.]